MQVILLQDIARVGRKHEVKQVPDGHAQNYLIPRKLAVVATAQNLKWQSQQTVRRETQDSMTSELATKFFAQVGAVPISITAHANEHGHLFKGIHAEDIARALSDTTGTTIDASAVELERPIKEAGEHSLFITLGNQRKSILITVKPI